MEQQNHYLQRTNLVLDHIRQHLDGDLSLEALARVAGFSPFHFHRIFKAVTGETLADVTARLRLERAAALMKASPRLAVTRAALECGFSSASSFSRAFRQHFGIAPRAWDRRSPLKDRKNRQVFDGFPTYTMNDLHTIAATSEFTVQRRRLPAQRLVYVRVFDSYRPQRIVKAYERLLAWYRARGGDPLAATLYGMSQDDPDVTALELCRYDLCLSAPDDWAADGEVNARDFPACEIASIHCVGDIYTVDRAWQYLYNYWLPRSRWQPANLPAMEIFRRQPAEIGWQHYDLDGAMPVVAI